MKQEFRVIAHHHGAVKHNLTGVLTARHGVRGVYERSNISSLVKELRFMVYPYIVININIRQYAASS